MDANEKNEFEQKQSGLITNELLTAKNLQEIRYKRLQSNFGKNKHKASKFNYWDLSSGLLGI